MGAGLGQLCLHLAPHFRQLASPNKIHIVVYKSPRDVIHEQFIILQFMGRTIQPLWCPYHCGYDAVQSVHIRWELDDKVIFANECRIAPIDVFKQSH
jgi:hypothetical protein